MRIHCPIIALLLCLSSASAPAQKKLMLYKPAKAKRIMYEAGDEIHLKLKDEDLLLSGIITHISDSGITIQEDHIPVRRIGAIINFCKRRGHRKISGQSMMLAAYTVFFNSMHRLINSGERPVIDNNTLVVAGVMAGAGLLFLPFKAKKYRLGNKWMLMIREP